MDVTGISRGLANETRFSILRRLKDPRKFFPPQDSRLSRPAGLKGGVSAVGIMEKGRRAPAASACPDMLKRCGLLLSGRHEKRTCRSRDEAFMQEPAQYMKNEL